VVVLAERAAGAHGAADDGAAAALAADAVELRGRRGRDDVQLRLERGGGVHGVAAHEGRVHPQLRPICERRRRAAAARVAAAASKQRGRGGDSREGKWGRCRPPDARPRHGV
jgi:hypothetical protein